MQGIEGGAQHTRASVDEGDEVERHPVPGAVQEPAGLHVGSGNECNPADLFVPRGIDEIAHPLTLHDRRDEGVVEEDRAGELFPFVLTEGELHRFGGADVDLSLRSLRDPGRAQKGGSSAKVE